MSSLADSSRPPASKSHRHYNLSLQEPYAGRSKHQRSHSQQAPRQIDASLDAAPITDTAAASMSMPINTASMKVCMIIDVDNFTWLGFIARAY